MEPAPGGRYQVSARGSPFRRWEGGPGGPPGPCFGSSPQPWRRDAGRVEPGEPSTTPGGAIHVTAVWSSHPWVVRCAARTAVPDDCRPTWQRPGPFLEMLQHPVITLPLFAKSNWNWAYAT